MTPEESEIQDHEIIPVIAEEKRARRTKNSRSRKKPRSQEFILSSVIKGTSIGGDGELVNKIKRLANKKYDPPIIFAWNTESIEVFLTKIISADIGTGTQVFQHNLIKHLQSLVPGCSLTQGQGNVVAGLACNQVQSLNTYGRLARLVMICRASRTHRN